MPRSTPSREANTGTPEMADYEIFVDARADFDWRPPTAGEV
ncbi:hypothetical protein ACF1BQ_032245 [Bradyrhizobium sp. RDT10]|nr:hypothetical protein [Bradyrhizobium sp. CSA112]